MISPPCIYPFPLNITPRINMKKLSKPIIKPGCLMFFFNAMLIYSNKKAIPLKDGSNK
jgi:hypothetical protein